MHESAGQSLVHGSGALGGRGPRPSRIAQSREWVSASAGRFGVRAAVLVLGTAAMVFALLAAAPGKYAFLLALLLAGTYVAHQFPVTTLALLLLFRAGPALFQMTGRAPENLSLGFVRLSMADGVMIAMLAATLLRAVWLIAYSRGRRGPAWIALAACYWALLGWMMLSIARNFDVYGLHTLGQFRYAYLILVVPAYMTLFLRRQADRGRTLTTLLAFSIGAPLVAAPLVAWINGWNIGLGHRIFPSQISLGLLFAYAALLMASERGLVKLPRPLVRALALPVAVLVISDSHRSVWLAALAMTAYWLLQGRVKAGTVTKMAAAGAAIVGVGVVAGAVRGVNILAFVAARGAAIVSPAEDNTAAWRLQLWNANLRLWAGHPWAGTGLGSYYTGNAAQDVPTTTVPHSTYVQMLVSLGAVGLALLLAVIVLAFLVLRTARKLTLPDHPGLDATLVDIGLLVLVGAVAYALAYSVDAFSCLWMGLALAAAAGVAAGPPAAGPGVSPSVGRLGAAAGPQP